jgi:hypothetical protein
MPLFDFVCDCGTTVFNEFRMGDQPRTHPCPACAAPMEILWAGRAPSVGFAHPIVFEDDDGSTLTFSSPEAAHRFERRTENEVREGLRRRPFVFRELTQDHSNFDVNVFRDRHPQRQRQAQREALARERERFTRRPGKPMIRGGATDSTEED